MLGVELDLRQVAEHQNNLLSLLQEQGLLLYMAVSYLLNVERVRIAPSFTHGTVLRIEPPLIADEPLCDHLIGALRRLLDVLRRGDSGESARAPHGRVPVPHATSIDAHGRAPGLRPRRGRTALPSLRTC